MDPTRNPDAGGNTTTVGAIADLDSWWFLEPGQTEQHDSLRLHLLAVHGNLAAVGLTDDEALAQHLQEHTGPGGIRNHDQNSKFWTYGSCIESLTEPGTFHAADDDTEEDSTLFNAHIKRVREPGRAGVKPWTKAPVIYQDVTQHTVSILPRGHKARRHFQINVTMVGTDWILEHLGEWYSRSANAWVPAVGPSFADCAIADEDTALELAREVAPTVQANERTALDALNGKPVGGTTV